MNGNQQHEQPNGGGVGDGVSDGGPPHFDATNTAAYIIPLQINGKDVKTSTTYKVVNPSTNELAWESCSASNTEAIQAAEAAQAAFPAWSKTKVSNRRDIFLKAADVMIRRAEELSNYIKTETGADETFTTFNVFASAEQLRDVAGRIPTVVGHLPAYNSEDRSAMILKEPFGVVLGIAPWYLVGDQHLFQSMLTSSSGMPHTSLAFERLRTPSQLVIRSY